MNFKDVPTTHWAHGYIADLYGKGILEGVKNDKFMPNRPINRNEFAAVLARALDLPGTNEVQAAIDKGLVKTTKDGVLNRQEAIWMLMNAYKLKTGEDISGSTLQFKDAKQIAKEYQSVVAASVELGFISGDKDGKFKPNQPLTRADAAKVVSLMLQK